MSLEHDLLAQSQSLARLDRRRPKQANLRRATSAAYYGLFHLLTDEASRRLVRTSGRFAHRNMIRRAFVHGDMRSTCRAFLQPTRPSWLIATGVSVSPELLVVAEAFDFLQQERHDADYNHAAIFTRIRALEAARRATRAFAAWEQVRGQPDADLFLIALLVRPR